MINKDNLIFEVPIIIYMYDVIYLDSITRLNYIN